MHQRRTRIGTFIQGCKDCGENMLAFDTPRKARFHPVQLSRLARALLEIAVSYHLHELSWSEANKLGGWLVEAAVPGEPGPIRTRREPTRPDDADST